MAHKKCVKCKIVKLIDEFYKYPRNKDGYRNLCKECLLDASKSFYGKFKNKRNQQSKNWQKNNRERANAFTKKSRIKMRDRYEAARIMYEYGITFEDYDNMLTKQNGVCAICHNECKSGKKLSIDHNHITGKVRGLLCHNCNASIGLLGDKIELLESALKYLKEND